MIYAKVIIDQLTAKTNIFTYNLKPDQVLDIKIGQLVEVPLRGKLTYGVVFDLTKQAGLEIKYIKPIKRLLSKQAIITQKQFELAKWLADYYGTSLGQALFTMIPDLSKKILWQKST